jgi:thymidylate synthase
MDQGLELALEAANRHETLAGAYLRVLRDIIEDGRRVPGVQDPLSIGSEFGRRARPTLELLGYMFQVVNPLSCLFYSEERVPNLPYSVASLLWTLSGSDDVESISFYNALGRRFSDDGSRLAGAIGARLLGPDGNQIEAIVNRLSGDPSSRRTVGVVLRPDDNFRETRDYPCVLAVQYLLRDGELHAVTFMRSQSALMVLPYDAFAFMAIQCFLAAMLQVQPGTYTHFSGSCHIYEDEVSLAERVLGNEVRPVDVLPVRDPARALAETREFEARLREATLRGDQDTLRSITPAFGEEPDFFSDARRILFVEGARRLALSSLIKEQVESLSSDPIRQLTTAYLTVAR